MASRTLVYEGFCRLSGAILTVLVAGLACAAAAPIAHWPMDKATDGLIADAADNDHDATYFATEGRRLDFAPGMVGKAVRLSKQAEGGFTVANSHEFNFQGPFTVMAWVKPDRRNGTFEIACMKGDKSGDPPWPGWRLRYFWTRVTLQIGTPQGQEPSVSTPEWSVPPAFWSHVAATWDGKKLRAFVNGVEKASTEFAGEIAPQARWRPLILGNYIGRKNAYPFEGLLDEVKIFDTALSEDEVFTNALK